MMILSAAPTVLADTTGIYMTVSICFYLAFMVGCGLVGKRIMKNTSVPYAGFVLGFFLLVMGLIVCFVIASSQRVQGGQPLGRQDPNRTPPNSPFVPMWKCMCGTVNRTDRQFCANCGRPKDATVKYMQQNYGVEPPVEPKRQIPETWRCMCGGINNIHSNFCEHCGKPKIDTFRALAANVNKNAARNYRQPATYSAPQPQRSSNNGDSAAEHIGSLRSLYDQGLISEEEYRDKIRELR